MKIYTKTGDGGTTSLFGGEMVDKNSARIAAYGTCDELNSLIGVILADLEERVQPLMGVGPLKRKLLRVQAELFVLGSNLALRLRPFGLELMAERGRLGSRRSSTKKLKIPKITKAYITRLEKEIDGWEKQLTPLKNFILPGGGEIGSKLHLARAVVRRAERLIVELDRTERLDQNILIYTNRLSDWFFVAARYANKIEGVGERIWKGRK